MGGTLGVVKLHVVEAGELGLCDKGVALGALVGLGGAGGYGEDVGLAVLLYIYIYSHVSFLIYLGFST